jgi:hypothetical protein
MRQTLFTIFFLLTVVSISQTTEKKWIKLKDFARHCYKKDIIKKDPLILLDGRIVGLLSEINLNNFKFNSVQNSSLNVIPKGSNYLINIFGKNARNGIINISNRIFLYCGTNRPKLIYIVYDKETDGEIVENLNREDIKDWVKIENVIDNKGNRLSLTIINTKNRNK